MERQWSDTGAIAVRQQRNNGETAAERQWNDSGAIAVRQRSDNRATAYQYRCDSGAIAVRQRSDDEPGGLATTTTF